MPSIMVSPPCIHYSQFRSVVGTRIITRFRPSTIQSFGTGIILLERGSDAIDEMHFSRLHQKLSNIGLQISNFSELTQWLTCFKLFGMRHIADTTTTQFIAGNLPVGLGSTTRNPYGCMWVCAHQARRPLGRQYAFIS